MNEFDHLVKHSLKQAHYIRYADDFVFLSESREELIRLIPVVRQLADDRLGLKLHPDKLFLKTLASGVDFLGWVHFPTHRVLRKSTKNRMIRKLVESSMESVRDSYMGMLIHGNTHKVSLEAGLL